MSAITQQLMSYGGAVVVDPDWANVVLSLTGQGVNGGTSFPDLSPSGHSFAASDNAQTDTSVPIHGTSSIAFDGSFDAISAAHSADFRFQSDFTLELHVRPSALQTACLMGQRNTTTGDGWELWLASDGSFFLQASSGTPSFVQTPASVYAATTIAHLAVTSESGLIRLFHEGNLEASGSTPVIANETSVPFKIGSRTDNTSFFTGHMAHIRITDNVARYTATFTPDTPPYPTS